MKTKKLIGVLLGLFFVMAGISLFKTNCFLAVVLIVGGIILLIKLLMNLINNIKSPKTVEENEMSQDSPDENKKEILPTDYMEDSFLLLSILKDNVNCSDSKIFSEAEKEKFNKKLLSIEENQIFKNCSYSDDIFPIKEDGIDERPEVNWIKKKDDIQFTEAVNLYIEMKEYLNYCKSNRLIRIFDFPWIWYYETTFFVTEKEVQLSLDEKDEFIKKCRMNNIRVVKRLKEFEFIDVFDSTKYILDYYTYPGNVDDAATYVYYYMMKIDSEIKTEKEKLSDKILNGIVHSYRKKEYFNDISLNQINIKIPFDKEQLYFLTVYVDATTGLINKFSFDIESACDTHYEFDIYGAEKLRNNVISSLPDVRTDTKESLADLMIMYLNKYETSLLIDLVKNI